MRGRARASPATGSRTRPSGRAGASCVVDTGGWEVDVAGLDARVAEQAEVAIELADAVLFVVDATVGATATDEARRAAAAPLRQAGACWPRTRWTTRAPRPTPRRCGRSGWASRTPSRPCTVAARATCSTPSSAVLPADARGGRRRPPGGPRRVALLGRPNVGKSSLLNSLAGSERVVVDAAAGTTRDPVDELVELGGRPWRFVDTAGIRRRVHQTAGRRLLRLPAHARRRWRRRRWPSSCSTPASR